MGAPSATREDVMQSRYLRTQFRIERAAGQRWHERYGVRMVINRWESASPLLRDWGEGRQNCRGLTRSAVERMSSRTNPDLRDEKSQRAVADYHPTVAQALHQRICRYFYRYLREEKPRYPALMRFTA